MKNFLKKIIVICLLLTTFGVLAQPARAGVDQCNRDGQCVDNQKCRCVTGNPNACGAWVLEGECGSAVIGGVTAPQGVDQFTFTNNGSTYNEIGLLAFISLLIRLLTIIAGLLTVGNFILGGYEYIVGFGNSGANAKVRDRLTWSIVGLVLIVSAYALVGIIGVLFFNDPTYILNPKIEGAI